VVVDIVLPAVLGLVLVREAGIEAWDGGNGQYQPRSRTGDSMLERIGHLPAGQRLAIGSCSSLGAHLGELGTYQ
jgi:hypothetical protein